MADELKNRLDTLRGIGPRLSSVTDEANRIVKGVEKLLVEELELGVAGKFCYDSQEGVDDDDNVCSIDFCIAFGRVNGDFQIHVLEETSGHHTPESSEAIPWGACSRAMKLEAFKHLPDLLDDIIKNANALGSEAEETAAKMRAMLGNQGEQSTGLLAAETRKKQLS